MTVSSVALTRTWIALLAYLLLLSVVGLVAIPEGQEIVIRWSWGDWTPVQRATKLWGLAAVPCVAALVALVSIARRRATDLEFVTTPFIWAEVLAISVLALAHTAIVLTAL